MGIDDWFKKSGTYAEGVAIYKALPNCNRFLLKSFEKETTANLLKLRYELKKAVLSGYSGSVIQEKKERTEPEKKQVSEPNEFESLITKSADESFAKETMAMYPMELHSVYRQRVSDFYMVCELKFQLNAVSKADESKALELMFKIEDLWTKIDKAWTILNHWKEHNRLMPTEESEDFSKLNGIQLHNKRSNLESSISKRKVTINKVDAQLDIDPHNRVLIQKKLRKLEELQQLETDLETIRNLLRNEGSTIGAT